MNVKSILKYQFRDYRNTLLVMYLCVYFFVTILSISNSKVGLKLSGNVISTGIGGVELASMITLFVIALNSYKPYIKLFFANGVSRKTLFCGVITGMGITAVAMALIDTLNTLLFSCFIDYQSMFALIYQNWFNGSFSNPNFQSVSYTFPMLAQQFLWFAFAYFWIAMVGFFITSLYYRMNKNTKIAVSIGVPVSLLYVLPLLDHYLWNGVLTNAAVKFICFAWGISNGYNPYIGMTSMFIFAVVAALLAWLIVRRTNVKA